MGHSGASLPLQVDRLRVAAGAGHAANIPRDCRSSGWGIPYEDVDRWAISVRHTSGRKNHSRGGYRAHGRRPEDFRAERLLPGARREEPFCNGRRSTRDQPGQKSDADDHGAVLACFGVPACRSAKGESLMLGKARIVILSEAKDLKAGNREDL